ncbi:ATP-dependent RNA helicase DBP2-like [Cryptotermes secundus]|uniref:ATP-dependent RNA helicase DBP2-like n=1 Tax=Cryptotermes secundus TaxID=105785 RepID=UPI000CD7C9B2|nr:ATP-dependent RNA helicase DBP2-like [Cryptotermes secundus]
MDCGGGGGGHGGCGGCGSGGRCGGHCGGCSHCVGDYRGCGGRGHGGVHRGGGGGERCLGGTNCEHDGATLLDNLQSFLREPDVASRNPSTSHDKETPAGVPESFHVAQKVQEDISAAVHAGDMEECSDTEQFLTCPSEKLVETVGTAVTLMECIVAKVGHFNSVEQHITTAIKSTIDFKWIRCTGCSLHYQRIVDGIVRCLTTIYIPWWCK